MNQNNIELYQKMVVDHNYANKSEKIKHSKPLIFTNEGKEIFDFYKAKIIDYNYDTKDADADPEEQLRKAENMIERLQELNLQMSSMMDQLLLENYELHQRLDENKNAISAQKITTQNPTISIISDDKKENKTQRSKTPTNKTPANKTPANKKPTNKTPTNKTPKKNVSKSPKKSPKPKTKTLRSKSSKNV